MLNPSWKGNGARLKKGKEGRLNEEGPRNKGAQGRNAGGVPVISE